MHGPAHAVTSYSTYPDGWLTDAADMPPAVRCVVLTGVLVCVSNVFCQQLKLGFEKATWTKAEEFTTSWERRCFSQWELEIVHYLDLSIDRCSFAL